MNRIVLLTLLGVVTLQANISLAQNLNAPSTITSQELLQSSTKAWFSVPDARKLDEKFLETQLGKLSQDEKLAPFTDSIRKQFRGWLNDKNVRLGLDVNDVQNVRSGEICIAGILPQHNPGIKDPKLGRGSHGMVLLVDVAENLEAAEGLLKKLGTDLTKRGATEEPYEDVNGAKVTKWKFPPKSKVQKPRYAFHTITNGWMLSSDNESIFREIVRRLVNIDNVQKSETLASQSAFQNVMNEIEVDDQGEAQAYWYVNPFGYIQLAQAIAREEQGLRQTKSDDWARILQKMGFDGFKAIGGSIRFATKQHEMLLRTFVYKPVNKKDVKQRRIFDMFDFMNKDQKDLHPPAFVPDTVSSYLSGTWNLQMAFKNVGYVIDTFTKSPGTFDKTIASLRVEMNVDVPKVISKFDNQLMIVTDTAVPIREDSERMLIAVNLNGDHEFVTQSIISSWPHQNRQEVYQDKIIVEIDDSIGAEDIDIEDFEDDEDDPFRDPSTQDLYEDEEIEEETGFSLFQRRFCSTCEEHLFVANNDGYMKKVLQGACDNPLSKSIDYIRVMDSLDQLSEPNRISFRQFSRLDRTIRPNYEMLRKGKMVGSNTLLARLLNHIFESNKKAPDAIRKQQLDGSTLPSNFETDIAPHFGPAGWVLETSDNGWLITGVMLERKEVAGQVVKKDSETERK